MILSAFNANTHELLITIDDDVKSTNVADYSVKIRSIIESKPFKKLILNLKDCKMVDSSGLGFLYSIASKMNELSIPMDVIITSPTIRRVMRFSKLDERVNLIYEENNNNKPSLSKA